MKVIALNAQKLNQMPKQAPIVLALGFFDGVHQGHQQVIQTAKRLADERHMPLAVMTFNRHASRLFQPDSPFRYLNTIDQKTAHMAENEVNLLYIADFDQRLAGLTPTEFVDQYLLKLNAQAVVAGFDYTFGRGGSHGMADLDRLSDGRFDVVTVKQLTERREKVSSTRIRHLIGHGEIKAANALLGYAYELTGKLTAAHHLLIITPDSPLQQLPAAGRYFCIVRDDHLQEPAMVTVEENQQITVMLSGIKPQDNAPISVKVTWLQQLSVDTAELVLPSRRVAEG